MKLPDLTIKPVFRRPEEPDETASMVFDDEPLEQILYGKKGVGPTPANLYLPAYEDVREIKQEWERGNVEGALRQVALFLKKNYLWSTKMCCDLMSVAKALVPAYPNPVITLDLSSLGPMLAKIWKHARNMKEKRLQVSAGESLYRWYEHHGQYAQARRVLIRLISIARERGDRIDKAVMVNNLAFEYLLETKWQRASRLFARAAEMFKENGIEFEHANARANYWIARFEYADFKEIEDSAPELEVLAKALAKRSDWRTRKPLILLANIEERNNLPAAIQFVQKAIEMGQGSNTRYLKMDERYLEHLKNKKTN